MPVAVVPDTFFLGCFSRVPVAVVLSQWCQTHFFLVQVDNMDGVDGVDTPPNTESLELQSTLSTVYSVHLVHSVHSLTQGSPDSVFPSVRRIRVPLTRFSGWNLQ